MREEFDTGGILILTINKRQRDDIYKFLEGDGDVLIEPNESQGVE